MTVDCLAILRIARLRCAAWLLLVRTSICAYFGLVFPILEAARFKALVYGRWLAEIASLNPAADMDVFCECCVLSGRVLCVGLITLLEDSYRM